MKHILLLPIILISTLAYSQNPYITGILNDIKIDSLVNFVENISGEKGVVVNGNLDTIYSRHKSKPGNELAYKYILQEFERFGLQTDSMVFSATGKNALAIQPGLVYPNKYYIICGHYDDMPNLPIAPAADDDGSGTGAVLEAARVLSNYQFEYTIIYAIWDEEEQGLVGSNAYADAAQANGDSLMGVINIDAIAWDSDNDDAAMIHTRPIGTSLQLSDTIQSINTNYSIGLNLAITNPGATYSDHASFWSSLFGAVLVIQDWSFDSNPYYHTDQDLVVYFNLPYFEKLSKLSLASLAALAIPVGFTGTHDFLSSEYLKVYPNPVNDVLNVQLPVNANEINVSLFNSSGQIVYSEKLTNRYFFSVEMENYEKGLYFLSVRTGDKNYFRKIIR